MQNVNNHYGFFKKVFALRTGITKIGMLMILAVFLCTGALSAQEKSGEIFGTVTLDDGSYIPGVAVEATGTDLPGKVMTVAGEEGQFRLLGLPHGTYKLVFMLEGFITVKKKINIKAGESQKVNIMMEIGLRTFELHCCNPPLFDPRVSEYSKSISEDVFNKLPKGRDFTSLLAMVPGSRPVR